MSVAKPAVPMKRIASASAIGSIIEFYDFIIFGTAAALVFSKVFFPALGSVAGATVSLATFGVAFVARPFGSILFGHFGDRIGRKGTLVTTLVLMGLSTVAIGLLPTADSIGVAAPILLVFLRIIQGIAVGGEWAGASLLTLEYAPDNKRGFYGMFAGLGPAVAFVLSSLTFLAIALTMSSETFLAWGWRIPFLASSILVAVGLYVRLAIAETPVFKAAIAEGRVAKYPLGEVFRLQRREVVVGAGCTLALFALFYIGVAYLTNYGTSQLGLTRTGVLSMGIVGGLCFVATTIVGAAISDRLGRRRVLLLGNCLSILAALILFPIVDIGTIGAFGLGLALVLGACGLTYGPVAAYLPELFATRYRYTGASVAYNLAAVIGGGITPLLAVQLADRYGSMAIGYYLAALSVISLACLYWTDETRNNDLEAVAGRGARTSGGDAVRLLPAA